MRDASAARHILTRVVTLVAMGGAVAALTALFDETPAPVEISSDNLAAQTDPVAAMAQAWNGQVNFTPSYTALNPYADAAQQTVATQFDPHDEYWGLPRTKGYDTVAAWCGACHTLQIVMAQRQSPESWEYLLHWMVEKQGMARPPADTHAEILGYLSREFGEKN